MMATEIEIITFAQQFHQIVFTTEIGAGRYHALKTVIYGCGEIRRSTDNGSQRKMGWWSSTVDFGCCYTVCV